MKKIRLVLICFLISPILWAQVSINTRVPQGTFHLDAKGNTSGSINLKDDIIITTSASSGVNVSLGGLPIEGASIALQSANKGFLPNRVELMSSIDITTIPSPQEGMIVYNTKAAGTYPNNVLPGYYQFNGTKWIRLKTSGYLGVSETRLLKVDVTTVATTVDVLTAPILDFGDIEIFEDGAYAFSFNVSGTSSTGALSDNITRGIFYIHCLVKSVGSSNFRLVSTAEFDPPLFPNGQSFSITTIKGLELKAGDQLKFSTRYYAGYPSLKYKSNSTFLVYWQL
jgi:hypothetical protein